MKTILAISLVSMSLFSSAASACGMPPARGMSLAKAMEQVEAAPVVLEEAEALEVAEAPEVVEVEAIEVEGIVPTLAEVEEPAPLLLQPQVDEDAPAEAPAEAQATQPNS